MKYLKIPLATLIGFTILLIVGYMMTPLSVDLGIDLGRVIQERR